jgi:hypothetical protein
VAAPEAPVVFGSPPGPGIRRFRESPFVAKARDYTPSEDELRLLSEHLCYEVEMTYSLALWLAAFAGVDQLVHNAVLESFTIHLRQLIDFFWPSGNRRVGDNPDALAADFFEEGEWDRLRPERPVVLSEAVGHKVGWGVAHLTYGRAGVTPDEKEWGFVELAEALAPAVIAFVDNVDPEKLVPEEVERMKAVAEYWGGRGDGGAMQYLRTKT